MSRSKNNVKDPKVCLCMSVPKSRVEKAIAGGCNTLSKIFDATSAGVGPCGGSCRPLLMRLLDHYQETGTFPESLRDPRKNRQKKTCEPKK